MFEVAVKVRLARAWRKVLVMVGCGRRAASRRWDGLSADGPGDEWGGKERIASLMESIEMPSGKGEEVEVVVGKGVNEEGCKGLRSLSWSPGGIGGGGGSSSWCALERAPASACFVGVCREYSCGLEEGSLVQSVACFQRLA